MNYVSGMQLINNTIVFLDTGFFKEYKPNSQDYHDLFQYSKDGKIILCTSHICLEEWRTQKVNHLDGAIGGIRGNLRNQIRENLISEELLDQSIYNYLPDIETIHSKSILIIERFLSEYNIKKYSPIENHIEATWDAYFHGKKPFKRPKNREDIPDSWILASACDALSEEEHKNLQNKFCITGDGTLCDALRTLGFESITLVDLLALLQKDAEALTENIELQVQPTVIVFTPSNVTVEKGEASELGPLDKILSTAINDDVKEIYLRLLGFSYWLNTPSKQELIELVATRGFNERLIEACAVLLSQKPLELIRDTGNHYLPMNKEVCKEAANRVMPEILQMLNQG